MGIFARATSWIELKISHMLYTESKKKKHVVINGKKLEMLFLQTQQKCLGLTKDKTIQIFYFTFSFALFFTDMIEILAQGFFISMLACYTCFLVKY